MPRGRPKKPKIDPNNPHVKTIAEMDAVLLHSLRKSWLEAKDPKEKEKYMKKLDSALDERLRLMKLRDST
jgi:hypothetical protein